jgi:glycosyltransferase involved in cell wall biosynthesis
VTELPALTAIVVCFNEARRLAACLHSLRFCDPIIVVDLGSADDSAAIARQYGAKVLPRERVPIVEQIREELTAHSPSDWIVFLDPDEVFPAQAVPELCTLIAQQPALAVVDMHVQFHFLGKPLHYSYWGMRHAKPIACHRGRARFPGVVHRPVEPLPGYRRMLLPAGAVHPIQHYWADSLAQLFEKHRRYIPYEGAAQYGRGERFSWRRFAGSTLRTLRRNLITWRGWRGGLHGIFLSAFHAWYVGMGQLALRRHQRQLEARRRGPERVS